MKELYENAEIDVLELEALDVINTSYVNGSSSDIHYNPNCENEGPAGDAFL